jgi:hypothetical protein
MTSFPEVDTIRRLGYFITMTVTMISPGFAMNKHVTKYPKVAAFTLKLSCA